MRPCGRSDVFRPEPAPAGASGPDRRGGSPEGDATSPLASALPAGASGPRPGDHNRQRSRHNSVPAGAFTPRPVPKPSSSGAGCR